MPIDSPAIHCRDCAIALVNLPGRGWVHDGGCLYAIECQRCGRLMSADPLPTACPDCGGEQTFRLHHPARPVLALALG